MNLFRLSQNSDAFLYFILVSFIAWIILIIFQAILINTFFKYSEKLRWNSFEYDNFSLMRNFQSILVSFKKAIIIKKVNKIIISINNIK